MTKNSIAGFIVPAILFSLAGCSTVQAVSEASNFFTQKRDIKQAEVVENAATVSARLRTLSPNSALYNQLEKKCKNGTIVEVIVPAENAASFYGRATCFPIFWSNHPNVKPQADVLLINRTDLFVGGYYYGSNTPEVLQEYQFQQYVKNSKL